ncbi:FkbM family methyltransferase [Patescibacteria group bacterium]|nr:FkbM family methyltransferase [Patescibacteria group bacterium]
MKKGAIKTLKKIFREKPLLGRFRVAWTYIRIIFHLKFSPGKKTAPMFGKRITYDSAGLLLFIFNEIFIEEHYEYDAPTKSPRIIDAGANIGLAALYFKLRYPKARITCIESSQATFLLLKKNVEQLSDVKAVHLALAKKKGTVTFQTSSLVDGGVLAASSSQYDVLGKLGHKKDDITEEKVPADSLNQFLTEPIDLLKMDIEGAEGEVLEAAGEKLESINRIFLEHHELPHNLSLAKTVALLEKHGFAVEIVDQGKSDQAPGFAFSIIDARRA